MMVHVVGFERLRDEYSSCLEFSIIFREVSNGDCHEFADFIARDSYLFRGIHLCITRTSLGDFLVWELHAGDLAGHFGGIRP